MLREVHACPVDRAAERLGTGPPEQAWMVHFTRLWPTIETGALPAMDREIAQRVEQEFHDFVSRPFDFRPCLIHNDLGL